MKQASKTVTRDASLLSVYAHEANNTSSKHSVFDMFSELIGNRELPACLVQTY